MSNYLKRILALLLCLVMILGVLPTVSFAAESKNGGRNEEKKDSTEIWETINTIEDMMIFAKRGKNITADDYAALSDYMVKTVETSDSYKEGTIERHGDFFFWETTDGEPQGYSPRLRAQIRATANPDATPEDFEGKTETVSFAVKGGSPSSKNVAVFQPYYGIDSSFTTQYKTEGESIAAATGGTCTTYKTTNATIANIGAALSNCGVVIFDSHGDTDYYVQGSEDYVTQANTSYLCLQSSTGWTTADKASATGTYGTYYHAYNAGSNGNMNYFCFDGTAMANHMSGSCNNLVWMAICLGMATTGLHAPLRNAGVGVVFGHSQSTSFDGDYEYEEDFWTKMKAGENVATAFAYMTRTYKWDPAYAKDSSYNTIGKARYNYVAFPNIVSAEDNYQGHRTTNPSNTSGTSLTYNSQYGACNVQTVNSTWTLFTQYEVTASSNNTNYGTVSLSGTTITASPKTGYTYASPAYTVSPSGAATVTQNGNTFTVSNVSNNCNVQINFAAKQKATVTYIANNNDITSTVGSSTQLYTGDSITLPSVDTGSGADAEYTFLGWVTQTCDGVTTAPSYSGKGASYQLTASSTTFYALYSKTTTTGGGTPAYELVTADKADWSGKYLVAYSDDIFADGRVGGTGTGALGAQNQSVDPDTALSGTTVTAEWGDLYCIELEAVTGGYVMKTLDGNYNYWTNNTGNGLSSTDTKSTAESYPLSVTFNSSSNIAIAISAGAVFHYNTQGYFRFYKNGGQSPVYLYERVGTGSTTTTYTTSPVPHTHSTAAVAAVAATCGESGSIACWYCAGCGKYFTTAAATTELSDENRITAPTGNHSYGAWEQDGAAGHTHTCTICGNSETAAHTCTSVVTPPTATESGYTTYTCSVCNYSYTGNYTAALGNDFTVSFSVPAGVTTPANQTSNTNTGITLPTPVGTPSNTEHEYTFVGWVEATANDVTVKPTVYAAGSNYVAQQQITLKALYSYVVSDGNSGEQVWTLMESDSTLQAGQTVVFASKGKGATAGDISNSIMASVTTEFSGDYNTITSLGLGTVQMTVGGEEDAWTFSNGSALLGTTAAKAMGWDSGTTTWTVSIDIDSGSATISSTDSSFGRILYNASSPRFTTYTSATNTNMLLPQIYYLTGSAGTTYYTTELAAPCAHANPTAHAAAAATCTAAGNSAYWYCAECEKYFSDSACTTEITLASTVIAALGHSWGAWSVTEEPTASANGSRTRSCTRAGCSASETETISNQPVVTGYNLTTNGDVLVNAFIAVPDYLTDADSGMYVTINGDNEHPVVLSTYTETGDGFKVPYTVPAKNMQDTVTLRLYRSNGTQIALEGATDADGKSVTYSVQGYITQVLEDADTYEASYPGVTALCKAMSAYGYYAQVQQNYIPSVNAAAQAPITPDSTTAEEIAAVSTASIPDAGNESTTSGSIDGLSFYGASLVMLSKMTLRFYFTYTGSGTLTSSGTPLTQKEGTNYYYVDVTNIAATDFNVGKTVTVTDGTNSCTVSGYSVNRYVYKVLTGSGIDGSMVSLAKAIAYYGLKAAAYSANNS